jgi:hypothetical protein
MEKCSRSKCFGNMDGRCYVLSDTSGQKTCHFYREDLNYRQIMKETTDGNKTERPTSIFFGGRR